MGGMWWLWAWSHAAAISGAGGQAPCCETRAADVRPGASQTVQPEASTYPAGDPRRSEKSPSRPDPAPPAPTGPKVALRDEDVLDALGAKQETFLRCYRIAQRKDIMLGTARVILHVKVGPTGAVDEALIEGGTSPPLDSCLIAVAMHLRFPPPLQPVEAQLKLFFAPTP
jgi:hypothetical protein